MINEQCVVCQSEKERGIVYQNALDWPMQSVFTPANTHQNMLCKHHLTELGNYKRIKKQNFCMPAPKHRCPVCATQHARKPRVSEWGVQLRIFAQKNKALLCEAHLTMLSVYEQHTQTVIERLGDRLLQQKKT